MTATSCAGQAHAMVQDAARLFRPFATPSLLAAMHQQQLHVNAELMSFADQTHGAAVLTEAPVVTSVGRGVFVDLTEAPPVAVGPDRAFVDFLGFRDTVAFCSRNGLPVDSAIIATGAGARKFMEVVSGARDEMTDSKFEKVKRNRL